MVHSNGSDAFAMGPFTGNPAEVCLLDSWPGDQLLQKSRTKTDEDVSRKVTGPAGARKGARSGHPETEAGQRPVPPKATIAQCPFWFTRRAEQCAGAFSRHTLGAVH